MDTKLILNFFSSHFFVTSENVCSGTVWETKFMNESHLAVCDKSDVGVWRNKAKALLKWVLQLRKLVRRYRRINQEYKNRLQILCSTW